MCSSQVKKPRLTTEEMLAEFEAQHGITKLPTYSPGTGDKRYREAEAEYRKAHPPKPKYQFGDDAPKRGDK